MKRILLALSVAMVSLISLQAQDDEWINRTKYTITENCVDSVSCYTQVLVDVNMASVPDSANITFNIGTNYGSADIYTRTIQKTGSVFTLDSISRLEDGNISVLLGEYLISDEHFFVDVLITIE